jgi:hypothetical protein
VVLVDRGQTGDKLLGAGEPEMPAYNTRVQINHDPGTASRPRSHNRTDAAVAAVRVLRFPITSAPIL